MSSNLAVRQIARHRSVSLNLSEMPVRRAPASCRPSSPPGGELREQVPIAIEGARPGRPAGSLMMAGLRDVGKTVVLVGAGLSRLRGRLGRAGSYAERLFDFPGVGPLSRGKHAWRSTNPALAITHYSTPELEELIEAANRVCEDESGKSPATNPSIVSTLRTVVLLT